jgi:hypothetical protein
MPEHSCRICRVYTRMDMGGVENAILQLLREVDQTHMVVTHLEGMRAPEAREAAARYSFLEGPRFAPLMAACADASITHLHTINDHLLGPLAAQISGTNRIVQTIHNDFQPSATHMVDHSIVVGAHQLEQISTPRRACFIPNGVAVPDQLPEFQFWCEAGVDRPLRLVELRRPDKPMSFTLEQIAATGALEGLDFEGTGIGFDTPSTHPRIRNIGPIENPYPLVAQADVLVMGTRFETFGRTVYEAMAWGTLAMATPVPAFRGVFGEDELAFFSGHQLESSAAELRGRLDSWAGDPGSCRERREANHRRIRDEFSIQHTTKSTTDLYTALESGSPSPRSFHPSDLEGCSPEEFGAIMDALLSPGPFEQQRDFAALPRTARAIVLWTLVQTGRALADQRLRLLERALQLAGPRPILCLDLARELGKKGARDKALKLFRQTVSLDPQNVEAHLRCVEMHLQMGDNKGGRRALDEAMEANPGVPYLQQLAAELSPC